MADESRDPRRWLRLIHPIPPKPAYFRARVGRRLQRVGAAAIENSVYVAPLTEQSHEDLQSVAREISRDGAPLLIVIAGALGLLLEHA